MVPTLKILNLGWKKWIDSQMSQAKLTLQWQYSLPGVHYIIISKNSKTTNMNGDVIKQKLLERFSEFASAIMAKHKLNTLKQNDTPMHEYISKFAFLTRHSYSVDPSTPQTEKMILPFIDSLQNPFIKSKIRLRSSKTLSDVFQHSLEEDTRQKVRAVDFGEPTSSHITQSDINATRDNSSYKCGKDGHFIKDCPWNQDKNFTIPSQSKLSQRRLLTSQHQWTQ